MARTKRDIQKEQTKALLLRSAYSVFAEKGIINTRISDVAEAAGVSHGTVFIHFPSLETMIEEVVSEYGRKVAVRTHELAESCQSLEEFLRAHLNGMAEFESFYTRLVIENRMLPQGARDGFLSIQSAISFHFSRVLERESGLKDCGVPSYMLFNMWMGLVHYYLGNGDLFAPEGRVIEVHGESMIKSFIKLIK